MIRKILGTLSVVFVATLFLSFTAFMSVQTYHSGFLLYERFWSSQHWKQVSGRIVNVQAYPGCGRGGRGYNLDLKYEYQIGTDTYTNFSIFLGPEKCYSWSELAQLKAQFQVGRTVPIYVDPHRPVNAVLVRELGRVSTIFIFLIELSLLFATLISIRFALREWKENKQQTRKLADVLLRRSEIDRSVRVHFKW